MSEAIRTDEARAAGFLALLDAMDASDPAKMEGFRSAALAMRVFIEELLPVELHYQKKENVLFPWFESNYPRYRCVRLMWDIQDDSRRGLKELVRLLDAALATGPERGDAFDPVVLNQVLGRLYFDLNANIFREEYALFPFMSSLISAADGEQLFAQAREYGFVFLESTDIERFMMDTTMTGGRDGLSTAASTGTAGFSSATGHLPEVVIESMFSVLPLDMTWVDSEDKVRWFSDSPHRIFPRSAAIIGRDVRNCHPGDSVGKVVAIIESFRRGEKDSEAFWITHKGRFIHIEYFALRDSRGVYLGVLELSQDLTGLRELSGEKRLAD